VQSLEQEKAETILQGLDLLTDGTWCHMQLVSGELEAEMARRGLAIDFLRQRARKAGLSARRPKR
jgi:hypothetical protein